MTIRRQPSDFQVLERLGIEIGADSTLGRGVARAFAVMELEKVSLTTPEAVQRLAKAVGVSIGSVAFAGLKDKHAQTWQHVTIPVRDRRQLPAWVSGEAISGPGWSARRVGWLDRPIEASDIDCNAFRIVIRDLQFREGELLSFRVAQLFSRKGAAAGGTGLIVNYFGDQRFGSARHGEGFAANSLIRGDFEHALKLLIATPARKDAGARRAFTRACAASWGEWTSLAAEVPRLPERRAIEVLANGGDFRAAFAALPNALQQMTVDAYQSWLWNAAAAMIVRRLCERARVEPIEAADDFGTMVFAGPDVAAALEGTSMPSPSPMMKSEVDGNELWGEAMMRVLADEGLKPEDLTIPGVRRPRFGDAPRPLVVRAGEFEMSEGEVDELASRRDRWKCEVRFTLPRGAYATVLLRALGQ